MTSTLSRQLIALGLAASLLAPAAIPAAAAEEPDLNVEFVGLPIAAGSREVQIRITNISQWWANETTALVETTAPTAGNLAPGIKVENLDPQQSTIIKYTLAAGCSGQRVKVTVAAARNYADAPEEITGNNQLETAVCAGPGQPKPGTEGTFDPDQIGIVVRPDNTDFSTAKTEPIVDVVAPPGPHINITAEQTLTLRPTLLKSVIASRGTGGLLADRSEARVENETPLVGWGQDEGGAVTLDWVTEAQTAVFFDLSPLDRIERKIISTATLAFEEVAVQWTSGSGQDEFKPRGCVEVLALADASWLSSGDIAAFIPSSFLDEAPTAIPNTATKQWNVKGHVLSQTQYPDDQSLRHGYVIKGGMKMGELEGQDESDCLSTVQNIRLVVTYAQRS